MIEGLKAYFRLFPPKFADFFLFPPNCKGANHFLGRKPISALKTTHSSQACQREFSVQSWQVEKQLITGRKK